MVFHWQYTFEMTSRKEEGDYVDISGLVFIDCFNLFNLNRNILRPSNDSFICIRHVWISLNTYITMAEKYFAFDIFLEWRDAKKKIRSHLLQGLAKRGKFI